MLATYASVKGEPQGAIWPKDTPGVYFGREAYLKAKAFIDERMK